MADDERLLLDEVMSGCETMAKIADDEEDFRSLVDAFRAQDGESMHELLEKHGFLDQIEVITRWLKSKETIVLCAELSGQPPLGDDGPDIRELADLAVKLISDDKTLQLIVDAVQDRDVAAWSELIDDNGLEAYGPALCHYFCTVHERLVEEVALQPIHVQRPRLTNELRAAARALQALLDDPDAYNAAVKCVLSGDCKELAATIEGAGLGEHAFFICEWFCSWRCWLGWLHWARIFPMAPLDSAIEEMWEFAIAGGRLAQDQGVLERFVAGILREDDDIVARIAKELRLGPFCVQFAHWVCTLRCRLFCICVNPPRSTGIFTKIGGIYYDTGVNSHKPGNGHTIADNRAFFSTLRLNGGLSLVDGAPLIEYRFETQTTKDDGTPLTPWDAVRPALIGPTNIGSIIRPIDVFPFFQIKQVWVNNPGVAAPHINIVPDPDGWIKVPPMFPTSPMVQGSGWRFVPGADLIHLHTTLLKPYVERIDEAGVVAGQPPNAPLQTEVHYGVRMRIRNQGSTGAGSDAGTCGHIAINNTHYDHIALHAYWPGGMFNASDQMAMASIGIAELQAKPCSLLTTALTVKYTAAHSNLGPIAVSMEGPGGPYAFNLVPGGPQAAGELHGTAVPNGWSFAKLPKCAYLLKLTVPVLLTTGDGTPGALVDYIAFCKG